MPQIPQCTSRSCTATFPKSCQGRGGDGQHVNTDLQCANQEGTLHEVVNEEAEWTFVNHTDSDDDDIEEVEQFDEL
jgi:hypothetical protein